MMDHVLWAPLPERHIETRLRSTRGRGRSRADSVADLVAEGSQRRGRQRSGLRHQASFGMVLAGRIDDESF
jgi:hypothetical protein